MIEIRNYSIPDSAKIFDTVQIAVKAEEPNGCWSNLNFVLSKSTDTLYRLKAFGTYNARTGVCPTVIVSKDTIIDFIPVFKGRYLFYVNSTPARVDIDTMIVK